MKTTCKKSWPVNLRTAKILWILYTSEVVPKISLNLNVVAHLVVPVTWGSCLLRLAGNYLQPAAEGRCLEIVMRLPYLRACPCLSHYYILDLYIPFIYKDIFTKFAGNVNGYKNMSLQNFGLIMKNNWPLQPNV